MRVLRRYSGLSLIKVFKLYGSFWGLNINNALAKSVEVIAVICEDVLDLSVLKKVS